jgi:hypothetical protein
MTVSDGRTPCVRPGVELTGIEPTSTALRKYATAFCFSSNCSIPFGFLLSSVSAGFLSCAPESAPVMAR